MADNWKSIGFNNILPVGVIKFLDRALTALDSVMKVVTTIAGILQFFINSFSSFSTILKSFINYSQKQIENFTKDIANSGVYCNVLVPPAFIKAMEDNPVLSLSTGGFDGFIQRMKVALNNTSDKNAPQFSHNASIGGFIILLDSETLYDFYRGVDWLKGMFDILDLFPINTSPQPPRNVRGSSGYFIQEDGKPKFGIRVDWDAPTVRGFSSYRLSRSTKSGGVPVTSAVVPTKLVGPRGREEEGILTAMKMYFAEDYTWPTALTMEYNDPTFNNGSPVVVRSNPVNASGAYIDYFADGTDSKNYYYVVQSGFPNIPGLPGLWGPRTPELSVPSTPTHCVNSNKTGVIQHSDNKLEFLTMGVGSLGQWSSIKATAVIPFLQPFLDQVLKLTKSLSGALKTNTKSFGDFLQGIKDKFKKYRSYLEVSSTMITALENFFSGAPRVALLNIPPAPGGVNNFINRVNFATKPPGGFSGKTGTTLGIVFIYGAGLNPDSPIEDNTEKLSKTFQLIMKFLT